MPSRDKTKILDYKELCKVGIFRTTQHHRNQMLKKHPLNLIEEEWSEVHRN
nr:MAG TPA: hypothetical protein [Caudoviricetes sp.]